MAPSSLLVGEGQRWYPLRVTFKLILREIA